MEVGEHFDVEALAHRLVLIEVHFEEEDVLVRLRYLAELTERQKGKKAERQKPQRKVPVSVPEASIAPFSVLAMDDGRPDFRVMQPSSLKILGALLGAQIHIFQFFDSSPA